MHPGNRFHKGFGFAIVLAFLLLATTYSLTIPNYESPDEVGHFHYIIHILTNRSLPVQRVGEFGSAHHPPLYYAVGAIAVLPANLEDPTGQFRPNPMFIWAGQGGYDVNVSVHGSAETFPFRGYSLALHLARTASVLIGAVTVAFTVWIGWRVFPGQPLIGLLAGALVAFNPQFLFISGAVNNDNLLVLLSTVGWWQILRAMAWPEQKRRWFFVGALIGAAFLTKMNGGIVLGAVAGIALAICALRQRSFRFFVDGLWIMALAAVLLSGWWFVRNHILYGDPLGWRVYREVYAVNLRYGPLRWEDIKEFFSVQYRSFWGVFGWMNIPSPGWLYWVYGVLTLLGLIGMGVGALRRWRNWQRSAATEIISLSLLVIAFVAQEAYMLLVITQCNPSCYQGRYLFPAIAPLMILLSWGLLNLLPQQRWERIRILMVGAMAVGLLSLAVFVPFKVIAPAYRIVPIPMWRLWFVPHKADFNFGGIFRLRGYDFSVDEKSATVMLTLYWEALQRPDFNYSVFAHLVDVSDQLIAQKDHAPGESSGYPPIAWWPRDIIVDKHEMALSSPLPPGSYRFRVGVYNWATGERLPVFVNGEYVGDFVLLERSLKR